MRSWSAVILVVAIGCPTTDDDTSAAGTTSDGATATAPTGSASAGSTGADTSAATDTATDTSAGTSVDTEATAETSSSTTDTDPTETAGTTGQTPLLPCEELSFGLSCNNPQAAIGYPACSDYFGDLTGVEVTCMANPSIEVSESPCAAYEFYVGSCVFYNEAVPDRCYVTHVGADSADLVEAGRAFWQNPAVCANWTDGP